MRELQVKPGSLSHAEMGERWQGTVLVGSFLQ
jgi:hypothetical protein